MENHKPKRLTRRGKLVVASAATAGALLMSSVAWACTTDPTGAVPEWIHATIHCLTEEIPPEVGPGCPVQPSNAVAVDFVAHGSGLLYNGKTVPVYQDDDDINTTSGAFQSAIGGCEGGDPEAGTVTYGRQTVGNFRVGTGTGTLVPFDGPGLYGICAGPAADLSALGQFIFV